MAFGSRATRDPISDGGGLVYRTVNCTFSCSPLFACRFMSADVPLLPGQLFSLTTRLARGHVCQQCPSGRYMSTCMIETFDGRLPRPTQSGWVTRNLRQQGIRQPPRGLLGGRERVAFIKEITRPAARVRENPSLVAYLPPLANTAPSALLVPF